MHGRLRRNPHPRAPQRDYFLFLGCFFYRADTAS